MGFAYASAKLSNYVGLVIMRAQFGKLNSRARTQNAPAAPGGRVSLDEFLASRPKAQARPRTPLDAMNDLRQLAREAADRGTPLDLWLSEVVTKYDIGSGDPLHPLSFEQALGLAPAPGADGWRTLERRAKRDDLLRRLAAEHFAEGSLRDRCARMELALRRRAALKSAARTTLDQRLDAILALGGAISASTIERAITSPSAA